MDSRGLLCAQSRQTGHSVVVTYGFWQWAWQPNKPITIRGKGREDFVKPDHVWDETPQTGQAAAAAGELRQSVINEPTGRWDYMPNCTANQSIPEMTRQHQLVSMTHNQSRGFILRQWLNIHNLPLHPSFLVCRYKTTGAAHPPDKEHNATDSRKIDINHATENE